ncbi:MAG: hypothetical protein IT422_06545 [Pirellulaceae bacterium]|nr:hypothetical protein [Pirellulaceae bacterium]
MLKLGILRSGPRADRALQLESQGRGWWPFSYGLLSELQENFNPASEALLERLYSSLMAGNTALKITRRGRFKSLDEKLAIEMQQRFGRSRDVRVHDGAASSAITSLELFRTLNERLSAVVHASDWYDALWFVQSKSRRWTVVFDAELAPLQIVGMNVVLACRHPGPWRYPVNRLLRRWLMSTLVPELQGKLTQARLNGRLTVGACTTSVSGVQLFHPECLEAARNEESFKLVRQDIMRPTEGLYDVVRVMNALTPRHMPDERVRTGIKACLESLSVGGLLVLGRSPEANDDATRVTVYEWDGKATRVVWEMNGGYEWPDLVNSKE